MIVEISQPDRPFHTDPDWKDWASFLEWVKPIGAEKFLKKLISDHLLKKRFKAFLEAAIVLEKGIQRELENSIDSNIVTSSVPKLQIPIRPKNSPAFNEAYENWEKFREALVKEHKDLSSMHKKLRFSRKFRKEVLGFLSDAFAFEEQLSQAYES